MTNSNDCREDSMRYTLLLLPLCLVLLTGFTTPAAAPGPVTAKQVSSVTSVTSTSTSQARLVRPAGQSTIRMKAVPTTYSRRYKQSRELKPIGNLSRPRTSRAITSSVKSIKSPTLMVDSGPSMMRAPLSLERIAPDHTQIASLSAKRLLSLAQRDLTTPCFPMLITV